MEKAGKLTNERAAPERPPAWEFFSRQSLTESKVKSLLNDLLKAFLATKKVGF